jgi:hypothetical protein
MQKIILAAAVLIAVSACNPTKHGMNSLTTEQRNDGWQLLFDGKTTHGWHTYGATGIGAAWKVNDGTLWLDTSSKQDWQIKNGGDIVTDEEFENFDLRLEWKISKNGNNGVMFYVHEDKPKYNWPWETGPEMQILDNEGHADGKIHKHRAGDLYDLIASRVETVKPVGEWNQVEIKSLNGQLDLYLNGTNVVSTRMWDDNWRALIAGSKFKSMPAFGTYHKGHIALQDHGNMVWFRNVMVKRL